MKTIILSIVLCISMVPTYAQYISVRETDQSGKTRDLGITRQAIDINSQLILVVNHPSILDTVHAHLTDGSRVVDSLISALKLYRNYIEKLDAAVLVYERLFSSPVDSIDLTSLRKALADRARSGLAIVRLFPGDSRFARRREEELNLLEPNKGSNESFRVIMRILAEEMQHTEGDLKRLRKEAGYTFQLAAWIANSQRPVQIHLEGFDDLPPGEFFEYERNRLYLTPEQLQELEALNNFFEGMDAQHAFERIADILPGLAANIIDTEVITAQIAEVKAKVNALVTTATDEKNKTIEKVKSLEEKWKSIITKLHELKTKYTSSAGTVSAGLKLDLLSGFMDDFTSLSQQVRTLGVDIKSTVTGINFDALGAGAMTLKDEILSLETVCLDAANEIINHARESYQLAVYGRQINAAALELSDKVLKLAVDEIPSSTTLDLLYTGKREPGDLIVVKALLVRGDDGRAFKTEIREYPVMNALPHLEMSVAYAFARPVASGSNFKGGPLVSVLYKFRSHSLPYRNFLDPGIGLHAASYDFNLDDTPEFAGGIVVSVFKDYLQGGWGFNFNGDSGYGFVAVRIPLPTMAVGMYR